VWPYIHGPANFDSDLGLFKNFQIMERQKVQFRLSTINFLNHPRGRSGWLATATINCGSTQQYAVSVPDVDPLLGGGTTAHQCGFLNLPVDGTGHCSFTATKMSSTNTNGLTTGKPAFKNGNRTLTFALKYYF
jgi:hypothetical protein